MPTLEIARIAEYEERLAPARKAFVESPAVREVLSPNIDAALLELFLLEFSAQGVKMTEPVVGWIKRSAQRCSQLGFSDLGRTLAMHVKHEDGHHLMMISDAQFLAERWNSRHAKKLDVKALLHQPESPGVVSYRKVHEDVIESLTPFCQVAIEYEIGRLSIEYGSKLIKNSQAKLGFEALEGMSFVKEHVELDMGHAAFDAQEVERLLAIDGKFLLPLVAAGTEALQAYQDFVRDCLAIARRL